MGLLTFAPVDMLGNGVWGISLLSRYATEKYDLDVINEIRDDAKAGLITERGCLDVTYS